MGNAPESDVLAPRTDLGRADATLSHAAVDAFVGVLGGRRQLVEILQIGSGDPKIDLVLACLDDPLYAGWPLPRLCERAGLTVADFLRAYERAMLQRGEILATQKIAAGMVAVVDDVMRRAAPHDDPCPCAVPPIPTCVACRGTGVRKVYPDLDRQKTALELAKLLTKGGGLVFQQNTLVSPPPAPSTPQPGSLVDLQTAVQSLLRRPRPARVVDATIVPEETP